MKPGYIGSSVRRREDERLLGGHGQFVADHAAGAHHVVFLRSSEPHAAITRIDTAAAAGMPGVVGVFTAADLGLCGVPIPSLTTPDPQFTAATACVLAEQRLSILASDRVHYVGQPIAVVVAEDRYCGEDALEAIEIDYEALPVVTDPESASSRGVRCCSTTSTAMKLPACGIRSVIPSGHSPLPPTWSPERTA